MLSHTQLGNKNDLDGHASVKELIAALYVCTLSIEFEDLLRRDRQLDKITDRPVSVSLPPSSPD